MDAALREFVRHRASFRCEYCLLPQDVAGYPHHIEHIVAKKHGGLDEPDNLALACHRCNLCKGPNLAGLDPETQALVPLFHPRRERWHEHFRWKGAWMEGETPTGRATIAVLRMNDWRRLELRAELLLRTDFRSD